MPFLALPFRADNKGPAYCPAADENMSRQLRLEVGPVPEPPDLEERAFTQPTKLSTTPF